MAGRTLGVADAEPTLDALTVTGATALQGNLGLYGKTPIAQRAAAAQATSLISVTSTAVNTSIVAWMLEVSNTLAALGAWKGSA